MSNTRQQLPLIYSCSGCSDVAQLANDTALALDHAGEFEMSCIAGVGGKVPALVKKAQSGRPLLAIDGCRLHCASSCLENVGVTPDVHVRLYEMGYKKRFGKSYPEDTVAEVYDYVLQQKALLPEK